MTTYSIQATRTHTYLITGIKANSPHQAKTALDNWIADDFEDFETDAIWEFEVAEKEEESK